MSKLVLALALAAGMAVPSSADARGAAGFDGNWSVDLVTQSGSLCEARYSYSLIVQGGQIRPIARAGSNGATVSGRVGGNGALGLTVSTSATSGTASGRLQAQTGSGTWKVQGGLCSGRWTARRLTPLRTAQAD